MYSLGLNRLSNNRLSFAAASQVVTLTRVANKRTVRCCVTGSTLIVAGQFRSVQFMCCEPSLKVRSRRVRCLATQLIWCKRSLTLSY